jgi:hypothetical protein
MQFTNREIHAQNSWRKAKQKTKKIYPCVGRDMVLAVGMHKSLETKFN